jgi:hypothetical protein
MPELCLAESPDTIYTEPRMPNGLTHLWQIKISSFRWHHSPGPRRVKDRSAQFVLYTLDPLPNCGPSDAEVFPCGFEGAFVCHREDGNLLIHCYPEPTHSWTLKTEEAIRGPVVWNCRPALSKRFVCLIHVSSDDLLAATSF